MIDKELLDLLCCPETGSPLVEADGALLARLNEAIAAGRVKNRAGDTVAAALAGGLVAGGANLLYPIIEDLPVMLIDEAIPLAPIGKQPDRPGGCDSSETAIRGQQSAVGGGGE